MFLNLSQGEVQVRIWFGSDFDHKGNLQRSTTLEVKGLGEPMGATVSTFVKDTFSRKAGRKSAVQKFFNDPENYAYGARLNVWTKADRRALWQAVCPEFKPSARRKRKRLGYTDGNGVWHEKDLSIAEIRRLEG